MTTTTQTPCRRLLSKKLTALAKKFPVVSLIGPRQSGKTTLARATFANYQYVSLEEMDNRSFAQSDPRDFLRQYPRQVIIDEVQHVPDLLTYLQGQVDAQDEPGQYILTGSANLTMLESITQSLAGRTALMKLLPYSMPELKLNHLAKDTLEDQLFHGFYPRIYKHAIAPTDWCPAYIQTYLEKDIRDIIQINNVLAFKKFLSLCAGRHGQLLDITSLANDCGIARQTVTHWLSILEASFLIYLLPPYHSNFNKRLIKSPKLYFYDSGLVCSLLGIESPEQLSNHYMKGAIFEGYVITEMLKYRYNLGLEPHMFFWRNHTGHEIDCIVDQAGQQWAIEIKSGKTIQKDFFKGLSYWQTLTEAPQHNCYLIYGGDEKQHRNQATVLPWNQLPTFSDHSPKDIEHAGT